MSLHERFRITSFILTTKRLTFIVSLNKATRRNLVFNVSFSLSYFTLFSKPPCKYNASYNSFAILCNLPSLDLSKFLYKSLIRTVFEPFLQECYEQRPENQLEDASTATKKGYDDDDDLIVCWLSSKRKVTIQDFKGKTLLETELVEINANNAKLQCSYNELVEYKLIQQKMIDASLVVQDLKRNQYDAKRLPMITFGYSLCSSMVLLQEGSITTYIFNKVSIAAACTTAKHHYAKLRNRVDSQAIDPCSPRILNNICTRLGVADGIDYSISCRLPNIIKELFEPEFMCLCTLFPSLLSNDEPSIE
uniref:Uncharacterized protein n=1 Tax=Cucumis melo TaxID=3656 RepID=A0A9I9EGG3_CUCME